MDKLAPRIKQIAARIAETEEKRCRIAAFLRGMASQARPFETANPDSLQDIKIVGVDGGLLKKSFHGFDCALVRAAGVCFHYRNKKIGNVSYHPSKSPAPIPEVEESLSDLDWMYSSSMLRLRAEISTALECLEKFSPDILLMDGSIVPHYSDRPSRNSSVYSHYQKVTSLYRELYSKSLKSGTILAGVVEDSRSMAFCGLVKNDVLSKVDHNLSPDLIGLLDRSRDTNLLYHILERGDRTRLFRYSSSPQEHPILKDLGEHASDIFTFYLKTAKRDRPIKVDFLKEEHAQKLASVLLSISGQHSGYGIPAPLIEADNVAKLSEDEIEGLYSQILSLTGNISVAMRLRREQRPF